ncbi:MAG: class I SAM-dependent methyltransferase [Bacteroidetes bacterium]|nr:class I SAM-dependent methyltransferase [Bacteroidota bacterium]
MKNESFFANHGLELSKTQPVTEISQVNQWMFEKIIPYAWGNILEIGSGTGNIADIFVRQGIPITVSDPEQRYCHSLTTKFNGTSMVRAVHHIDLFHEDFERVHANLLGRFDFIIAINIIEHSPNNKISLSNAKKLLTPDGCLILGLPACTALYNKLDQGYQYWHWLNKQAIKKMVAPDFRVIKMKYFNLTGIVKQSLSSYIFGEKINTSERQNRFQESVPSFQIEDLAFKQNGLSLIAVAIKKEDEYLQISTHA